MFQANEWIKPASDMDDPSTWTSLEAMPQASDAPRIDYFVEVHTSKKTGSGTDAKVYLELRGSEGASGPTVLKSAKGKQLQTGKVDEFVVNLPDVGDVQQLLITQDGAGMGSDWHLDKVAGYCVDTMCVFVCFS